MNIETGKKMWSDDYKTAYIQAVKDCQEELLKHMFLMVHENGYPSEAVPKATILSLDKLVKAT